jgi:hypothetical protein
MLSLDALGAAAIGQVPVATGTWTPPGPPSPPIIGRAAIYLDDYITSWTTGATDSIGTVDYTLASQAMFAAASTSTTKVLEYTYGRVYGFSGAANQLDGSRNIYVPSNLRIEGNGATMQALQTAGNNTNGLLFTDPTEGTAKGPCGWKIRNLKFDLQAPARQSGGYIINRPGEANGGSGIYIANCTDFEVDDCEIWNPGGDGVGIGGSSTLGGPSQDGVIRRTRVFNPGRNGFSRFGCVRVALEYCLAKDVTRGHASGGLSTGYDDEPGLLIYMNDLCTTLGCVAINCADEGFASRAFNYRAVHVSPVATSCRVGFFGEAPTAYRTKVIGATMGGNGMDFGGINTSSGPLNGTLVANDPNGLHESISGF